MFSVAAPVAIVLVGFLLGKVCRNVGLFSSSAFYIFVYFIFAPVALSTLALFRCEEFDDGTKVVQTDMSVDCDSDRYNTITYSIGSAGLALYAVLPAVGFYGVLRPYKSILEKPVSERTEDESGEVAPMSFLWQSYRTGCWWLLGVLGVGELCRL